MAEASARRPKADARFFNGVAVVVAMSTLLWWVAGVIRFSAPGDITDFLTVAVFGLLLAIALGVATYVVALGPGALLWTLAMRLGDRLGFTERLTAQLAAPLVAAMVAVVCLVMFDWVTGSARALDMRFLREFLLFALPSAVFAEIYACLAWQASNTFEEAGK